MWGTGCSPTDQRTGLAEAQAAGPEVAEAVVTQGEQILRGLFSNFHYVVPKWDQRLPFCPFVLALE